MHFAEPYASKLTTAFGSCPHPFALLRNTKVGKNPLVLVSKFSLIKFLASDKGFAMQPKSEWHEKAIRWFIEVLYK